MRRDTRTVAVMGYGTPEEAAQEESLQETLSIIQDVAPTVQRLISGLPPAEQAAVLLLYTLAIGLGVTFLVLYGAKTIKELRQE